MKIFLSLAIILLTTCSSNTETIASSQVIDFASTNTRANKYVRISMRMLEATKSGSDLTGILNELAAIPLDDLVTSLDTKNKKLAFWINIYNGFVQHDLVKNPESFKNKDEFYKGQRHKIAGIDMSFDNMEHGILRNSRVKLSLGYLKRWFVKDWEKKLRNTDIDGRIHFALNCGAKSCPPVAIFNDVGFDKQINAVVTQYLENYTTIEGDTIKTSPLFSWFRGDFSGKKGMVKFLRRFGVVPDNEVKYSVEFTDYDWTLSTGDYSDL